MSIPRPKIIKLKEYEPKRFQCGDFAVFGEDLWRNYSNQVTVDFPSPKTDGQWQLTSQGWVGYIPLDKELIVALAPKVELTNLFRMLEYAYRLKSFKFLEEMVDCQTLQEFYERLANVLAHRILDRGRKGFYRAYLNEKKNLPFIRGRIDFQTLIKAPWNVNFQCHYQENSADIEENQILAWTLYGISHSGMCSERVLPVVHKAYRLLQGFITLYPFSPQVCVCRSYNRLNEDYLPLHALCRFFLEHSGPKHHTGDHRMLPFLVNMSQLYELFVSEWLKAHTPEGLELKSQEAVNIDKEGNLYFEIDLILYNTESGIARFVLDTKYKVPEKPSTEDIAQVVAYAKIKNCHEAVLIYPAALTRSVDAPIGDIRVRSLTFSLDNNIEEAGQNFIQNLLTLSPIETPKPMN